MFAYEEHFIPLAVKTLIGMKMSLAYEKHFIHRCKNINWYEDSFAYEKHLIHRCKNINSYEDVVCHMKRTFNTPL